MDRPILNAIMERIRSGIRNPTWAKLASLAEALDIPVSVIVFDAEDRCMEETSGRHRPPRPDRP